MKYVNLHIYPSPFRFESRILRETKSIIELGLADEVIIASAWEEGLSEFTVIDEARSVKRFRLYFDRFDKNIFFYSLRYLEFIVKVYFYYASKKVSIVNCHSLFVLPIGYLLKLFKRSDWLIYDAHELESLKNGLGRAGKEVCLTMEKLLIKKIDSLIVVSPSIAKWYKQRYNLQDVVVLRNTPELNRKSSRNEVFNKKFNIPTDDIILIYQGVLNKGRSVDLLLSVFKTRSMGNKHIVFMGYGPYDEIIIKHASEHRNIHFMPAVAPSEIIYYTSGADVGMSVIENVSLSYYYCLPNKFFEYLQCGIPVIASNFPDMTEIIMEYDCGWPVNVDQEELINLIVSIDKERISQKAVGVLHVREAINWEIEAKNLVKAYPALVLN